MGDGGSALRIAAGSELMRRRTRGAIRATLVLLMTYILCWLPYNFSSLPPRHRRS